MTQINGELTRVFDYINQNRDRSVDCLLDYVRHPSISAHNIGIRDVAERLSYLLADIGLEVSTVATAGRPIVVARWDGAPGKPVVLLYGHYDVQPPEPLELWTTPPFEPSIRDGRVFARGVADNKGQHLAQILAIEAYLTVHGRLPCNVVFLLEGEEEMGSPHMAAFVREHRAMLRADVAVTADGHMHASGRPNLKFGSRGGPCRLIFTRVTQRVTSTPAILAASSRTRFGR